MLLTLLSYLLYTFLTFLLLLLTLYLLFRIRKAYRSYSPSCNPIPGPPGYPFLGNVLTFLKHKRNTLPLFQRWIKRYGNTYKFTVLGDRDIVLVNDPETIKHVLSTKFREGVYGKGAYQQEQYRDLIGMGIFNSNPPLWKQQRKCAAPLFFTNALKSHVTVFQHHATTLCDELYRLHSVGLSSPDSSYIKHGIDIQDYFLRFTLDSFSHIGFGFDMNSICAETNQFATAFDYVQSRCFNRMDYGEFWPYLAPPDAKFRAHLAYMDQVVYDCIAKAKKKTREELKEKQLHEPDLLSQTLLDMTDETTGEPNASYSEVDLRDTVMNFLIAGRDTTALLLSWFFYQLSAHPDIEAKIVAEMDQVLSEHAGEITYDSMKAMVYLQQVIQESLRIYPSVPFNGFTALKDDVLPGGYFVPKNTYVVYSAYILHRREDLYPEPEKFDPERFNLKLPQDKQQGQKPFEYMSFHGGPRECLGREMAYLEAKIMIVTLLGRFRLRLHPAAKVELKRAIILTARKGIHMKLEIQPESPYHSERQSHSGTPAPGSTPFDMGSSSSSTSDGSSMSTNGLHARAWHFPPVSAPTPSPIDENEAS